MANSNFRLAVGDADGAQSTVWSIITTRNEVYALHRTMGHVEKISLHSSRICRRAYIEPHARPSHLGDRVMQRWMRPKTPPASKKKIVVGLEICFPSNQLSGEFTTNAKKVHWIPAAPCGYATIVQIVYTKDTEEGLSELLAPTSAQILNYRLLPNGEAVAVVSFEGRDMFTGLILPASMDEMRDLVVPMQSIAAIKRPVGLTLYRETSYLSCLELTGFFVPAGMGAVICPGTGTLNRTTLPHRNVPQHALRAT